MNKIIKYKNENTCIIADKVIMQIVGNAIAETPGVLAMISHDISGNVRKILNRQNFCYGVKVKIIENKIFIKCNVALLYGPPLMNISEEIMKNINNALIRMIDTPATHISLIIDNISVPKQSK